MTVDIKEPTDISAVYSPAHDLTVKRESPDHVIATYHEKDVLPATDIQVFYKPAKSDVAATFLTYQPDPKEGGYFPRAAEPEPQDRRPEADPPRTL